MRRRDVDHARLDRYSRDFQPFAIDGHTDNARTQAAKEASCRGIPRLFYHHPVARIDEDTPDKVQRLLRALSDDHVIRTCPNGPGDPNVTRNRRT